MKVKGFLFTVFVGLTTALSAIAMVENSIIPTMDRLEKVENVTLSKYSDLDSEDISYILGHVDEKVRIVTHNVLFPFYDHNHEEVNRWPQRVPRLVEVWKQMDADIIGVQELYQEQLEDLLAHLGDTYEFFAHPADDGELNGFFWKKSRFELIHAINPKDILANWSWGEAFAPKQIDGLTIVKLMDRNTQQTMCLLNQHFSFSKVEKRYKEAVSVLAITLYLLNFDENVVFLGDLNTFPNRPDLVDLPAYDGDSIISLLTEDDFTDSQTTALLGHVGALSTYTNLPGFKKPFCGTGTPGVFLDHIFVSSRVCPIIHAVDPATVDGHFPSDHMPVVLDAVILNAAWTYPDDECCTGDDCCDDCRKNHHHSDDDVACDCDDDDCDHDHGYLYNILMHT